MMRSQCYRSVRRRSADAVRHRVDAAPPGRRILVRMKFFPTTAAPLPERNSCAQAHASLSWTAQWLRPQWPAPEGVRAVCTSRAGGASVAPFDAMNLGSHVGDLPAAVASNRARLHQSMGARPVFLNQVHGTEVIALQHGQIDAVAADGSWTDLPALACTVMVADCLPVLLCSRDGGRVAALHAGWRGLSGVQTAGVAPGIIARFLQQQAALGVAPWQWLAWLGPCIGPLAFEVGEEVRAAFLAQAAHAHEAFVARAKGKWSADLALLARQQLQSAGVEQVYGNDSSSAWCTVRNPSRYFSYRRDRVTGRQAAAIWRV